MIIGVPSLAGAQKSSTEIVYSVELTYEFASLLSSCSAPIFAAFGLVSSAEKAGTHRNSIYAKLSLLRF